jgi:hypothetical protein
MCYVAQGTLDMSLMALLHASLILQCTSKCSKKAKKKFYSHEWAMLKQNQTLRPVR